MFTKKGDAAVLAKLGDAPHRTGRSENACTASSARARRRSSRSSAGDSRST